MTDVAPPKLYEAHVEPDSGFRLPDGEAWQGYRVKYRAPGARRWSTFVLEMEPDRPPTVAELQLLCASHAEGEGAGGTEALTRVLAALYLAEHPEMWPGPRD